MESLIFFASAGLLLLGIVSASTLRRRHRERWGERALAKAVGERRTQAPSLHPVIDPNVCIGSLSCIKACPEGDILGVINGRGALIEGANCVGHGRCASECPVHAIRLVFGTSERGVDLPEVDESFESSRPGVHIVGELGGMGLIRNCIRQGLELAAVLAQRLHEHAGDLARTATEEKLDLVIVGAGPAGLATAVGAREAGLTFRLLEQRRLGGTIANYPRQKIVMSETVKLPQIGNFGRRTMSKEELLAAWERVCHKLDITVEEDTRVDAITGEDGEFTVTASGKEIACRKVVLATGRRGTPRKLGVPGEERSTVTYQLIAPEQYDGRRVLVVGGSDSAVEAAIALAGTSAEVTLSYRGASVRARPQNQERLNELVAAGKVRFIANSQVTAIEHERVLLATDNGRLELLHDYVLVCIGGELPLEFLAKVGVTVQRHFGSADKARAHVLTRRTLADWTLVAGLSVLGVSLIALLAYVGRDYYLLPAAQRLRSPLRTLLRPSGTWGHGVGIVATLFMIGNFGYAVRKHWRRLKGGGPIRRWLTVHMFVGFLSPIVIAFHAAFQSRNHLATATFASLVVVVLAGIFGRFIYNLVPQRSEDEMEPAFVLARAERLLSEALEAVGEEASAGRDRLRREAWAWRPRHVPLPLHLLGLPLRRLHTAGVLWAARRVLGQKKAGQQFCSAYQELMLLGTAAEYRDSLRRLLASWRVVHVSLSILLVLFIVVHIGVSLYLGYGWVFM